MWNMCSSGIRRDMAVYKGVHIFEAPCRVVRMRSGIHLRGTFCHTNVYHMTEAVHKGVHMKRSVRKKCIRWTRSKPDLTFQLSLATTL